jgi:hypothetical protein
MPLQAAGDPPLKIATPEVMAQIKQVIAETQVPSWLNSVPYNFGDAGAGMVKADEWRNLSTIFLPLALIRMWGEGTQHPSSDIATKFRHILDHTMLLVSAVSLACKHTMTAHRSAAYLQYMTQYIRDFLVIHIDINPRPNMHMAMHIPHFLHLFGPVRSWWCFPFERLIGQIQRLHSNHKFGNLCLLHISVMSTSHIYSMQGKWSPHYFIPFSKLVT